MEKRIKWLQNIKHWTDMALEKIMIAARNGEEWKRIVCQRKLQMQPNGGVLWL